MNDLVFLKKDEAWTDSLVIAEGTGVEHRKLKTTIRKHRERLEGFGKLSAPYEAESTGGRPEKYYVLNEEQATFLVTLLKNTDRVVSFKAELVRQFYEMRRILAERQTRTWLETRQAGKLTRKAETDVIQQLVEYARAQGSSNADKLYIAYSRLANKFAGIQARDAATAMQLNHLQTYEGIALRMIQEGMAAGDHYKSIYQKTKQRFALVQELAFLGAG